MFSATLKKHSNKKKNTAEQEDKEMKRRHKSSKILNYNGENVLNKKN